MTVRVLADFHHADLWESLEMLFTDRFGWELYRLYDMDWFTSGIWQFEKGFYGDRVARQYLQPWGDDDLVGDHYERDDDVHPGRVFKMLTMEQARSMPIDIVLATLSENQQGLKLFAMERGAAFGIQIGNQGSDNLWGAADFAMCSTTLPFVPWKPHVFYHQEFDLGLFRFEYPPTANDYVGTWVQCLKIDGREYDRFQRLARDLPELRLRYHGHCGEPDDPYWGGNVSTTQEVAAQMRSARVGLHLKTWSDGYGHVVHNLFAVGKPVVGTASYYHGSSDGLPKLASPLFVEGETSFDVQTKSHEEVVALIRRLATDDELHQRMSENAARRFREVVSFDADAEAIRVMIEGVLSGRRVAA